MSSPVPFHQQPWVILGAPLEGTGEGRGEVRTPALLRAAGIRDSLAVIDQGDLNVPVTTRVRDPRTGVTAFAEIVQASEKIRAAVAATLIAGRRPLLLGGCCSVLPGAFAGARAALGPVGLLFVDGHLDLHTGATSRSGNLAGMGLAVTLGQGAEQLTGLYHELPMLRDRDLVAVGYDPTDPDVPGDQLEKMAPNALGYPAPEVIRIGAARVGKEIARRLKATGLPVWVHLDVDVLDSIAMPAVSYPGKTAITWQMLEELLRPIVKQVPLAGIAVADFNADLDDYGDYARAIIGLLADSGSVPARVRQDHEVGSEAKQRTWGGMLHDLAAALLVLR